MGSKNDMVNFSILSPAVAPILSPRLGKLAVAGAKPLCTPHYIPLTTRGAVPHLSHDVIRDHTSIGSVYLGLEDFIEKEKKHGGAPIYKVPKAAHESALRKFICAPEDFLLIMGPRRQPAIVCPPANTSTSVCILTSVGFRQLSADEYIEATRKLRPDIVVGMADLILGRTAGKKRSEKMVDRTHGHTRDAAERLYANSNVEERAKSAFFAPILPLENTQQLLYLEELQDELRDYISGLALYESASLTVIPEALGDLPRLLFNEPASPHEVLKEISLGADLITLPFLVESSDSGMALDFVFPPPTPEQAPPRQLASNMWSPTHATDLSTLSENCKCFTCQNHHRAYLNHLLNAKEMLAWTLLQIHNHHVLDNFFAGVRESIKNGTFEQDAEAFHKVYAPTFPERTGQGPRLRGYQLPAVQPKHLPHQPKVFNRLDDAMEKFQESNNSLGMPDAEADELESKGFAERKEH